MLNGGRDGRLKLSNVMFLCLDRPRQRIVRVLRVFFLEVWSDFQGLQRFCQCRIIMALVHWALIHACSGNGVSSCMGIDIM
jgi:hypothetical protein